MTVKSHTAQLKDRFLKRIFLKVKVGKYRPMARTAAWNIRCIFAVLPCFEISGYNRLLSHEAMRFH